MDHRLGKWAVIDTETTGADANYDQVIDLGFLEFEGTKLIKKYSSLVNFEGELSSFIQKLTGINSKMLKKAPSFKSVEGELQELYGHKLIAHNSDFEAGFLQKSFDKIEDGSTREEFVDSLYFLAILFSSLHITLTLFISSIASIYSKSSISSIEISANVLA